MLCAPALTAEGVRTMRQRWPIDALNKWELEAAHALLEEHILTPEVLSLPHFSEQAMRSMPHSVANAFRAVNRQALPIWIWRKQAAAC